MAVNSAPGWWVWSLDSRELANFDTELEAISYAEANTISVDFPLAVIPCTIYKYTEDEV